MHSTATSKRLDCVLRLVQHNIIKLINLSIRPARIPCGTMNSDTHAGHAGSDHTDHAASPYQFKNEVRLTIGDADAHELSDHATKSLGTPAPSPRLYGGTPPSDNDRHSDDSASTHVPSPDNSTNDTGLLMRHSQSDDLSRVGLDNAAFEAEPATTGAAATPLSSFGQTNGNGKTPDKPTAEAVNLELVNIPTTKVMAPVNSSAGSAIAAKKQTAVNISDNYDEYFVPVNEHRKYMR